MAGIGAVMVIGITLTVWWSATSYRVGQSSGSAAARPPPRMVARRYMRGVAIAIVGGFWAGAIVTGPVIRLIMRLLAVTSGDDAQGRITEAEEVVGRIDLGGTIGLIVFGGILPGMASGALYVVARPWLPGGRLTGVTFGALHLVFAATILDPLRPDNQDFDIVGPGWLSVATFSLACLLHGMAVVAFANRYSGKLPAEPDADDLLRAGLPLALPAIIVISASSGFSWCSAASCSPWPYHRYVASKMPFVVELRS